MNEEEYRNGIVSIAEHYQYLSQSRQLIEEMAELTVAINKWWRLGNDMVNLPIKRKDVIEEISDVEVVLEQVKYLLCCELEVEKVKREKVERQLKRMESEEQ